MDRRQPLLLSEGERRADAVLREALEQHGLALDRKVRLASVLQIEKSGLSDDDFSYALRAELDFLVTKGPAGSPEFAVEFDGSTTFERSDHDRPRPQEGAHLSTAGLASPANWDRSVRSLS